MARPLRDETHRARALRGNATPAERVLWELLRRRALGPRFRRQHPLGPFIADFFCCEASLVVEVDGSVHDTERARRHDTDRDAFFAYCGVRVLRLRNDLVLHAPDEALERIRAALRVSAPSLRVGVGGRENESSRLMPTLLLASASPRRRALLETLGHRVLVHPTSVDEDERPGETARAYLERVVDAKLAAARAASANVKDAWDALLVADTTVDLDGGLLHKPTDEADARRILRALSGRAHVVTTRFAIATPAGSAHVESVATRVVFRAMEEDEIDAYAASGEGTDKAGGYAIQGLGAAFVQRIEGSYGAVVGLPSCEVSVALRRLLGR